MYLLQSCSLVKKTEIQPGFEPGSSEHQSDALTNWATDSDDTCRVIADTQFTWAAVKVYKVSYFLTFAIYCRVKPTTRRSSLKIELCLCITIYPLLQCKSCSGSVVKSIWLALRRPRFKSWLDLNLFQEQTTLINTSSHKAVIFWGHNYILCYAERVRNKSTEKNSGIQLGFEPKTFWILVRHSYN